MLLYIDFRVSRKARNRWLVAYTLLNNPTLRRNFEQQYSSSAAANGGGNGCSGSSDGGGLSGSYSGYGYGGVAQQPSRDSSLRPVFSETWRTQGERTFKYSVTISYMIGLGTNCYYIYCVCIY